MSAPTPIPREGEYYWVRSTGYDPENPVFVARYSAETLNRFGRWYMGRDWFNHDKDVAVLRHVPKPRSRK